MKKNQIPLNRLSEQYFITCRTEGKTPSTMRGYQERLGRFVRWSADVTLVDFSIELVREYISYLQAVPKWQDHPTIKPNGTLMSAANVRNHVRVLRRFSTWLEREEYTDVNILQKLRVPKALKKILKTLSHEEIGEVFSVLDQNSDTGCRNAAILLLFLDTGLRCSEPTSLSIEDVHLEDQWLKVMGKGQKERIVPFGSRASKLLQRFVFYFRPEAISEDRFFLRMKKADHE